MDNKLRKIRLKKKVLHSIIWNQLETFELETETLKIVFASTSRTNPEINMFITDVSKKEDL